MNIKNARIIDVRDLKPEQIAKLQSMIEVFTLENQQKQDEKQIESKYNSLDDIFFESEILQPFNRNLLYGERI